MRSRSRSRSCGKSSGASLFLRLNICFAALLATASGSRTIPEHVSAGGIGHMSQPFLRLDHNQSVQSASDSCDGTYGFMPCTSTALGNLFLILMYGHLMFVAANYLSNGCELLLEILGPGIIGGLFLPVLGALPDSLLILASGLSGTAATAQDKVSVGMGLLAGSIVMLLTVIWGTCVFVGKCDIERSVAIDETDTKGFDLIGSGGSTDIWTSYAARIMSVSVFPFLVVQIPQMLSSTSGRHLAVLIALILSLALLISYCLYQVFYPWIQERRIQYAKQKHMVSGFLKHLKMRALGRLLSGDGRPNKQVLEKLFRAIDEDNSGHLSAAELKAFVIGIQLDEKNIDELVATVMKDFDTHSTDSKVSLEEFIDGISRWFTVIGSSGPKRRESPDTFKYLSDVHEDSLREHALLGGGSQDAEEGDEVVKSPTKSAWKAGLMLSVGTVTAAIFADPLVDAVDNFSDATSIPSFFISFIALPLLTSSSDAVSAIIFARRKRRKFASLAFSALYGAVTMSSVLSLSVFLALVYVRGLTWDFSSEVLVVIIVCVVMGALVSFRTSYPLWTAVVAFALYPFSLILVYVLKYRLGWS